MSNIMRKTKIIYLILLSILILSFLLPFSIAQSEDGNYLIKGLELEKLIALINAWISTFLFVLAFVAYRRLGRKRLLYVSIAFLLFAVKSFLISSELFFTEVEWFDPLSTILEFGVLLSFFYGVLKK